MKKLLSLALALAMALSLTACGGGDTSTDDKNASTDGDIVSTEQAEGPSTKLDEPPQVEQILNDVVNFHYSVIPENATVTGVEVVKRQSNPENKEDIVYCRLTGPQNGYMYSQYYVRLLYNFYDEGGWILDEMTPDMEDQWGPIGYLDSEGKPLEEGFVDLGRDAPKRDEAIEEGEGPDDEPFVPEGSVDTPVKKPAAEEKAKKDSSLVINNEGQWQSYGSVYDFQGNKVSGLMKTSSYNRAFVMEGDKTYLCDLEGNKLSAGYEKISYSGTIKDEEGNILDHRWKIEIGGKIGFLNDAGEEVASPQFDAEANRSANYYDGGTHNNLCVVEVGDNSAILNQDGILVYTASNGEGLFPAGNYFLTSQKASEGYRVAGYDSNGDQIFSGNYYTVCYNAAGFCGWAGHEEGWELYDWDGYVQRPIYSNEDETIWGIWPLGDKYYDARYDGDSCLYHLTGPYFTSQHIVEYFSMNYDAYDMSLRHNGGVMTRDGFEIIPNEVYNRTTAIEGGLFMVEDHDGRIALFDLNGNQRTQFFDDIVSHSENGRFFIVEHEGKYYGMKSPLSEEEISAAGPANAFFIANMAGS